MIMYPNIDPVALTIGDLEIRWYGVMYLVGILGAFVLTLYRGKKVSPPWNKDQISDLTFYVVIGLLFGGRIGFVLFYQIDMLLDRPWSLLEFWAPGRSFHGGLIGSILAGLVYCKLNKRSLQDTMDFIAPQVPIGFAAGRLGNFLNQELWGRVTDVPWGMVFPNGGLLPRHPSQLYEMFLEGFVLCGILLFIARKPRHRGFISGMFLIFYALFRIAVEFVREPDPSYGFILFDWMTMGQILCIPMILLGLYLLKDREA